MQVLFSKTFTKSYKKLDEKIKIAFGKRLEIFLQNEFDPITTFCFFIMLVFIN